jgi:hypothetical protein
MKKTFCSIVVLLIIVVMTCDAQKKYKFTLGLENGEIIQTNTLKHVEERGYFQVKRDRYIYEDVDYLIDGSRYYLKSDPGPSMYLRRVEGENVCAYSGERTQNKPTEPGYGSMFGGENASGVGEIGFYYQKKDGPFKKMVLENLKEDLKDNDACMLILAEISSDKETTWNRNKMMEALEVYNKH